MSAVNIRALAWSTVLNQQFLKEAYHQFCQQNKDLPVFFQDWYLDAVCDEGIWETAIVKKNKQVVAVLPYYLKKKGPFQYITMPSLTKMMGPFITKQYRKEPHFTKICKALIEQLPKVAYYEQLFSYNITNWLPFYWKNFQQTTRYSYLLDLTDLAQVYANFSADYRNNKLKKAKETVSVVRDLSLKDLYAVNKMSFDRQGLAVPYSFKFLERLDKSLATHQAKASFFAIDSQQQIHAIAYLIWDKERAYYLLAGDNPSLRNSGAGILLVWQMIQFAKEEVGVKSFDFQGSMLAPIERVRRQFGAEQKSYFLIQQHPSKMFKYLSALKGKLFG